MFLSCLLQIFCVILQRFLQSITIKNMKKFLTFIFLWLSVCTSVSAQITDTFSILKIRKAKNDCYRLTAKSNGKKYVIYSHYDVGKNAGKKIKCNDKIELEIEPFLETKQIFLPDFKKQAGWKVTSEDSVWVETIVPFNYLDINFDYYGNILKVENPEKKMLYHTSSINGIFKKE